MQGASTWEGGRGRRGEGSIEARADIGTLRRCGGRIRLSLFATDYMYELGPTTVDS